MTPAAEIAAMSYSLSPPRQNHLLSQGTWTAGGRIKILCTHATTALLRYAGVTHPRVMDHYHIPVKRDTSGFLVVDLFPTDTPKPLVPAARIFQLIHQGTRLHVTVTAYDAIGHPIPANDHQIAEAAWYLSTTDAITTCELQHPPAA